MQNIPLTAITVSSERQRREFEPEALAELADSIRRIGLMHPVVVRPQADGGWTLVAGERRLRAIAQIGLLGGTYRYHDTAVPAGMIPCASLGELAPLEAEEAELEENIRRKDLTWQEHAAAVSRLHDLRTALAAKAGTPHTVADTAEELEGRSDGFYHEKVRRALITAKFLDRPEVAKAKTLDDAFKILRMQERSAQMADSARAVGATYTTRNHSLQHGDCLKLLAAVPAAFDVIITDPPYGISANEFGNSAGFATGVQHEYDDSPETFAALMTQAIAAISACAKPQAHLYIFCDIDRFHFLRELATAAGWHVFRTPLVMVKAASGRVPWPDKGPRRQYELVLFAERGDRRVNTILSDVFTVTPDENLGHPAQKAVAAYLELLRRSVQPGDRVLDPFCGTGPVFPAATTLQCYATGIELAASAYGMAHERLAALQAAEGGPR